MPGDNNQPVINKYLGLLNKKLNEGNKDNENFFYIFRGQPLFEKELDCTAARHFKKHFNQCSNDLLKDNQKKIISDLRIRGFGDSNEKQRPLYDLELLADLRHYGTPSCLIDFTSDFLIALWFSCGDKEKQEKDGKVFILNCYDTDRFSIVSSKTIKNPIDHFFQYKFQRLWYWIPERLNQRLTDQDAVFVFGNTEIKEYESIRVKKEEKEKILKELEKFFDYSKKTLFSDKYAIGENYKDLGEPENLLEEAVYYIQTGDFSKAKELLKQVVETKGLELKNEKLFLEAKFQLGFAKIELIKEKLKKGEDSILEDALEDTQDENAMTKEVNQYYEDQLSTLFKYCIARDYKEEKINRIKEKFKQVLNGILPPIKGEF